MANGLSDKIPAWLKSLYEMENELRDAARNGLILRNEKASEHLAGARRHLDDLMKQVRGGEPKNGRLLCAKRAKSSDHQGKTRTSQLPPRRLAKVRRATCPRR